MAEATTNDDSSTMPIDDLFINTFFNSKYYSGLAWKLREKLRKTHPSGMISMELAKRLEHELLAKQGQNEGSYYDMATSAAS